MEACCVCGCKVFDVEEGELEKDMMYCDYCSAIITCGVYPNHILVEVKQAEYQHGVYAIQKKRYKKIKKQIRKEKLL
jgi:hypothetical protein